MPPIKRMKSDSGWADLNFDIGASSQVSVNKKTSPKHTKKISIEDDTTNFPIISSKKEKTNNLSTLLDACNPTIPSELAVSRQKQNELADWLCLKTLKGKPNILVVTGPSGCGKTVALKVLAKESGFDVIEWITPVDNGIFDSQSSTRQTDKFLDFMIRATRYNSIFQCNARRLLLVKDIPNIYFFEKENFHHLLAQYMELGREPLVFVLPDSESSRNISSLFPAPVVEKFGIDVINLHAATPTAMKNMLKRVSCILNSKAGHLLNVTQNNIDEVLSNSIGDVRSTILNTVFRSLRVPDDHLKKDCSSRTESLGLLHGVGRVINPKREPDGEKWKFVHDPDDIASYFQSQSSIFLHFLQENYLNTMSTIDNVDRCSEIMSLSDTITSEWRDPNLMKVNLSLCIRGVMVNNENPATKWNPVRKPKSEETKIQRDLNVAEEIYFKSIINPKAPKNVLNIDSDIEES